MTTAESTERSRPHFGRAEEVRDDDGEAAASHRRRETVDGRAELHLAAERRPRDGTGQTDEMTPAAADRDDLQAVPSGDHRPDAVATRDCETGDGHRDGNRQVALPPVRRAEVEASRPVDEDGDIEIPLGDGIADVGLAGPGEERPIHPSDVVAGLVRPRVARLDAVAEDERRVAPVTSTDDPPADAQLDPTQPLRQADAGRMRSDRHRGPEPGSPGMTLTGTSAAGQPWGDPAVTICAGPTTWVGATTGGCGTGAG